MDKAKEVTKKRTQKFNERKKKPFEGKEDFKGDWDNPLINSAFNANKIQEEINDFENGLKKLFEITGVNDVNEVIQKFITQDETESSLQLTRENYSDRLEELIRIKGKLREAIESLKFDKGLHVGNHQLEKKEDKLSRVVVKQERLVCIELCC